MIRSASAGNLQSCNNTQVVDKPLDTLFISPLPVANRRADKARENRRSHSSFSTSTGVHKLAPKKNHKIKLNQFNKITRPKLYANGPSPFTEPFQRTNEITNRIWFASFSAASSLNFSDVPAFQLLVKYLDCRHNCYK